MIELFHLKNFKAWKNIEGMKLSPITGLFGSNSSGKSSILQFFLMLKQTVESDDRRLILDFGDENSKANLGNFKDMIFNHNDKNELSFKFSWKLPSNSPANAFVSKTDLPTNSITFDCKIAYDKNKVIVKEIKYIIGSKFYYSMKLDSNIDRYELESSESIRRNKGRAWPLPAPVKFYGFPDETNAYYQNVEFLSDLQLELTNLLKKIHYLGPLREYPKRSYISKGTIPSNMGSKGEYVIDAILASRERDKYISPGKGTSGKSRNKQTLEQRVAYWLKELGLIHSFKIEAIKEGSSYYEVKVKKTPNSSEVLITDVGFGVSQILPVLVMCYYAEEGSILMLEQPEIHLHPSVQTRLADVFIDVMQNRNIQIILESHSEHLLNRLQRRLAESVVGQNDISLFFCQNDKNSAVLNPLEMDTFGNIKNWPKDFFGDQFSEIAARQKAQLERQIGD
jgi:predicted ATPase